MNFTQFDELCESLRGTTMVIQWGDSHVHKIGGKLFALANQWEGKPAFVMKATPLSYEILLEQRIATRAPYLTRGNWLQIATPTALPDADLASYIKQSYQIIAAKLSKASRTELGIIIPQ